jgi:mannose/cellobiose epimerase-like protein (N-acyl-D-glucosamine 2-epimerase family)
VDARSTIEQSARRARRRLRESMLPYWLRVSRDERAGGFLLHDDISHSPLRRAGRALLKRPRRPQSDDKQLVTQARLVWVFAHAHRTGYGNGNAYLDAAHQGRAFLVDHFRDPAADGYRWKTDRDGRPVNDVKLLYGQAFVIYAFVELARASGSPDALTDALALFRAVERELHDDRYGGWREDADGDWSPVAADDRRVEVAFSGRKSANAILHWLEATTELYAETGDAAVRRSLEEAVELCRLHAFPPEPAQTREPFLPDWTPDPQSEPRSSYGHNVEFAWLMLHAQQVLGVEPDWGHFHAYLDHTLRVGFDHARGGAFMSGRTDRPADSRYKVWWVQCELMVALSVALTARWDDRYAVPLAQTLDFVERYMTDRSDGVLFDTVYEDGRPRWRRKSGNWKAGYHEVRAAVRLAEAFS